MLAKSMFVNCKNRCGNKCGFLSNLQHGQDILLCPSSEYGYGKPILKKRHLNLFWIKSYKRFLCVDFFRVDQGSGAFIKGDIRNSFTGLLECIKIF